MSGPGFTICGATFYGYAPKRVIEPSSVDFSVPRTCTLPEGHAGAHLSDPDVLRSVPVTDNGVCT